MISKDISGKNESVLVTTRAEIKTRFSYSKETKDNITPLSWHSPLSLNPPLFGILIGKTMFSKKLIDESGVFAVNFMQVRHKKQAEYCSTVSGEHIDKFEKCKFTKEESESIDCPRIKEAAGYIECEVINKVETGDHFLYIGKILKQKLNSKLLQKNNIH